MNRVVGGIVAFFIGLLTIVACMFVEVRYFGILHMRAIIGIGIGAALAFLGVGEKAGLFAAAYSPSETLSLSNRDRGGADAELEHLLRKPTDADKAGKS
jgi:hypothetical protein